MESPFPSGESGGGDRHTGDILSYIIYLDILKLIYFSNIMRKQPF